MNWKLTLGVAVLAALIGLLGGWELWGGEPTAKPAPAAEAPIKTEKGEIAGRAVNPTALPLATVAPDTTPTDTGEIVARAKPHRMAQTQVGSPSPGQPAVSDGHGGWVCDPLDLKYTVSEDKNGDGGHRITVESDNGEVESVTQTQIKVDVPRTYPNHLTLAMRDSQWQNGTVLYERDVKLPWLGNLPVSVGGGIVDKRPALAMSIRW